MERTRGRLRRALLALALSVAALVGASLRPAVATDLDSLRRRAQEIADEVTRVEHELQALRNERARIEADVVRLTQQIALLEVAIESNSADVVRARRRYVERAVAVYKEGASGRLALVLSSDDFGEMLDAAEAAERASAADQSAIDELTLALEEQRESQLEVDRRKQQLLGAQQRNRSLVDEMESKLEARGAALGELTARIDALEAQARLEAARAAAPDAAFAAMLAGTGPSAAIPDGYVGTGVTFEGIASWYGPGFEGNTTASGDVFDSDLYTAASRDLPLGTRLFIQHDGRGVVVVVNDRGPFIEERILDLSRAAAEAIGITGIAWVTAEIVVPAQ
jgi:peptidoglycan hydrolase CwlO-like protein